MSQNSLEQEALERVARMYSSYDRRQERRPHDAGGSEHAGQSRPAQEKPPEKREEAAKEPETPPQKPAGLLNALLEDKEQSLIMLLLIILMKDGADLNLILALMYILI